MYLFNKTNIPTPAIFAVLKAAKTAVGSVPSKVGVRVSWARYAHGVAWDFCLIQRRCLGFKREPKKMIGVDGYVEIWISRGPWHLDPLRQAENLYETAAHEFRHIKDFDSHASFNRHKRWANRPQERRAMRSANSAVAQLPKRPDWQDAIINLGIEIEKLKKG